jgi:hypothetical protein
MSAETYYVLEKVRYYRCKPAKETELAESENLPMLIVMADEVNLRRGKTFGEKVRIAERVFEDNGDYEAEETIDYPYIRYWSDQNDPSRRRSMHPIRETFYNGFRNSLSMERAKEEMTGSSRLGIDKLR